jgi:hypothetical protein
MAYRLSSLAALLRFGCGAPSLGLGWVLRRDIGPNLGYAEA